MPPAAPRFAKLRLLGRTLRVGRWNADAPGRPLLVFNGIATNLEMLTPVAHALGRPVVAFDMPGVGGSPDPVLPYTAVSMAATAGVLLDRLGIERADVMGISWGGGIAQQFALQHRPRTGALILAASSAGLILTPGALQLLAVVADPFAYAGDAAMQRHLARLFNGGGGGAAVSLNAARPASPSGWLYQLGALLGWSSVPLLPWLDVPTLILAGGEDEVVPSLNARILHALIPGSRLDLFAGGGHLFMLSHTADFAAAVNRFLTEAGAVDSA